MITQHLIMIAIKKYLAIIIFTLLTLTSCDRDQNISEKNKSDIINLLINQLAAPIDAPLSPPPPKGVKVKRITNEDSLKRIAFRDEWLSKKRIVAVKSFFYNPNRDRYPLPENCKEFESLLNKFKSLKRKKQKVELSKIKLNRKDSLIYFQKEMLGEHCDYENFDILAGFSQVIFNEAHDKAIISAHSSTSCRSGGTYLYFLKRKGGEWFVKCSKTLSIS